jgi:HPt (histidine-containing phosphotransfer) domain-containing protein
MTKDELCEKLFLKYGLTKEEALDIIKEYSQLFVQKLEEIKNSLYMLDYGQIKNCAHSLKGASANIMYDELAVLFSDIEKAAVSQNEEGVAELLHRAEILQKTGGIL